MAEMRSFLKERVANSDRVPGTKVYDLLRFWNRVSVGYPILSCIASKYMCVPASSLLSEVVFSNVSRIVASLRCSLTKENVESLSFLYLNAEYVKPAILALKPVHYRESLVKVYEKIMRKNWMKVM